MQLTQWWCYSKGPADHWRGPWGGGTFPIGTTMVNPEVIYLVLRWKLCFYSRSKPPLIRGILMVLVLVLFSTQETEKAATTHRNQSDSFYPPPAGNKCQVAMMGSQRVKQTHHWDDPVTSFLWRWTSQKAGIHRQAFGSIWNSPAGQRSVTVKEHGSILHNRVPIEKENHLQCLCGPKSTQLMKTRHHRWDEVAAAPVGWGFTKAL